jgi:DNA-binding transcriptional MerR regulator|tara:strand:+ start:717 stop:881 length:165 start_codon:yes stop_codon:yes gene_type:complete
MKDTSNYSLMTTKEASEHFKVSPYTIRVWAKSGKIKEINLGYRTKRYDISDLIL